MLKVVNKADLVGHFLQTIKNDKKTYKRGIIRYEIKQNDKMTMNCIDSHFFTNHLNNYIIQGFSVSKIVDVKIGKIPAKMYILEHENKNANFEQYDSLAVNYFKASNEITFFEVVL